MPKDFLGWEKKLKTIFDEGSRINLPAKNSTLPFFLVKIPIEKQTSLNTSF